MKTDAPINLEHAVFLIRPRPVDGESTMGYLMRVAEANGYQSVRRLCTAVGGCGRAPFDKLCDRLLLTPEEKSRLVGVLPRHWGNLPPPLGLSQQDFNHTCRRWCPVCLSEKAILHGTWGMKLVCVCTRHSAWLRDVCVRCGQTQRWGGVTLRQCHCGAMLADAVAEPANAVVRELTAALSGEGACLAPNHLLAHLGVPALHRMVRYLGLFSLASQPSRPGQIANLHHQAVARELVTGLCWLMGAWPMHFHDVLAALQAATAATPSVQRAFWPLYRVLYVELATAEFHFLRDAFEDYLHRNWWGVICRRNRRLQHSTVDAHPRLTITQAARAADVAPSVVHHLVQAKLIATSATSLPSGRQARTLHQSEVERLRSLTLDAVSLCRAAEMLALPESRVRQLIRIRVVVPLVSRSTAHAAAQWLIAGAEIARFQVPTNIGGIALHDILKYWRLTDQEVADLVLAVLERRHLRDAAIGCSLPIGETRFYPDVLRAWLNERRVDSGTGLSVAHAARILRVKQEVAYGLVRHRLLHATSDGGAGLRVSAADIEQFRSTYISLAEYARMKGRSSRALLADIRVAPVCGPGTGNGRQYFFRRADVLADERVRQA